MNSQTVLMSLASTASGVQFIPIALGTEFDEIVIFAPNTYETIAPLTAVTIGETFFSQTNIATYAPFTLILNPSALDLDSKIYKIEYDFGNGNVVTQTYYYSNTSEDTLNYPFSAEPGDPRNYFQSSTYFLENTDRNYFTVEVRIYQFGFSEYKQYFVNLQLDPPVLDGSGAELGYFKNLHLVSTRMFGPDDTIFYVFESDEPRYILPALVNWQRKETTSNIALQDIQNRPYKLLKGFERENITSVETNAKITFVDPVSSSSNVIDIGI